jgi:hypothetical protein
VERLRYESVMPGTSIMSGRTRRKRRRRVLMAAWLPVVRRNVWLVVRKTPLSARGEGAEPPPAS